jgi:hypothetical protein
LADGGSSPVLFSLHDPPDIVNRMFILSEWDAFFIRSSCLLCADEAPC